MDIAENPPTENPDNNDNLQDPPPNNEEEFEPGPEADDSLWYLQIARIQVSNISGASKIEAPLDSQLKNWSMWSQSMRFMLDIIDAIPYVEGKVDRPDPDIDPEGTANWRFNDRYVRYLIDKNITENEKIHIGGCESTHHMWKNLSNIHHTAGTQVQTNQR